MTSKRIKTDEIRKLIQDLDKQHGWEIQQGSWDSHKQTNRTVGNKKTE
jgi:hypothetical protein